MPGPWIWRIVFTRSKGCTKVFVTTPAHPPAAKEGRKCFAALGAVGAGAGVVGAVEDGDAICLV
jgi:hypothetical protein